MDSSTLNGQLLYIIGVSILDAAILSWVALRWYQRSVSRMMRPDAAARQQHDSTALVESVPLETGVPPSVPRVPLDVALVVPERPSSRTGWQRDWPADWPRVAAAYVIGAALFSTVVTIAFAMQAPDLPVTGVLAQWWINLWPVIPTLIALLALDRASGVRLIAAYLLGGSAAVALLTILRQAWRGSFDSAPVTNIFWMHAGLVVTASLPLLLILITAWRRIRAVMPLTLAATLAFGFALILLKVTVVQAVNVAVTRDAFLAAAVYTSIGTVYYAIYMVIALPVGWLGWLALKALANGFERKRFSDVQLIVDCWWSIATAETITTHLAGPFGLAGIAMGLAAFAAYRLGVAVTLRFLPTASAEAPQRLLMLRVFGYQARTETLFDRIAQRWRFRGPVQLIAGVDLATRTADPGDVLAFVGGRLREQYVSSASELPERLQRLDARRDPDGRFRVNELYCLDQTWRQSLTGLLSISDTVLMDLRGFGEANRGCVFEVEQLVAKLPTDRIVLVCDKTTDLELLGDLLERAWARAESERTAQYTGPVSLVRVERSSPLELDAVMRRLLGRGTPQQVFSLPDLPPAVA
jgi:hypothetical protein